MLYKKLLIIVVSLCFLSGCSVLPLPNSSDLFPESGSETYKVATVIDGDTILLEDGRKVRYIGINTPERDQPFYSEATDLNRRLVADKEVRLEFDNVTKDGFGRTLAYVYVEDIFVNLEIIRAGMALKYNDPDNHQYDDLFSQTIQAAKKQHIGMWQESGLSIVISEVVADPPGEDALSLNGEWVLLENTGERDILLGGFILQDQNNHRYVFPAFTLETKSKVRIYTGSGKNSHDKLYWGSDEPIWNNSGDTVFLYDQTLQLVTSKSW